MKATFAQMQQEALEEARALFPCLRSYHEGFAVLLEEVDELKAEVWKKRTDPLVMLEECVHVAAMANRLAEDLIMCKLDTSDARSCATTCYALCCENLPDCADKRTKQTTG